MYFIVNEKKVYSDALFGVTFDPKTKKIVEISFSQSSYISLKSVFHSF
jgi:hypothetical protein